MICCTSRNASLSRAAMNAPPRLSAECTTSTSGRASHRLEMPCPVATATTASTQSSKENVSRRLINTEIGSRARGKRIDRIKPRLDEMAVAPPSTVRWVRPNVNTPTISHRM